MTTERFVITGARVFDGKVLHPGVESVVVADGVIVSVGTDEVDGPTVDAHGGTLLPGLIDAHMHTLGRQDLAQLAAYGVTTGLDMASWPAAFTAEMRAQASVAEIRSAGVPGIGPGGPHAHMPGMPAEAILTSPEQARAFVEQRVADGVDYIKVVTEAPGRGGPEADVVVALVEAAHAHGLRVVPMPATSVRTRCRSTPVSTCSPTPRRRTSSTNSWWAGSSPQASSWCRHWP